MLILGVAIHFGGISQTSNNDSVTCVPNAQLRSAVNQIEQGRVAVVENGLLKAKVAEMTALDQNRLRVIHTYQQQNANLMQQNDLNEKVIDSQGKMLANDDATIKQLQKKNRKQSFIKWIYVAAGVGLALLIK